MKTKFELFTLNESMKTNKTISFKDDIHRIDAEAGEKMAQIFRDNLVGRLVSFHTENFKGEDFKTKMSTSHSAIMNVEDVIYRQECESQYCNPYLIKSSDRKHYTYYDISPTGRFYFVDTFINEFKDKYFDHEITFTGSKNADALSGFSASNPNIKKIAKCVPVKIIVSLDAMHQGDLLRVYAEDGKYFYIDYKKPIKITGEINPFDPYGEEQWED